MCNVPQWRCAKQPVVFATELERTLVANLKRRVCGIHPPLVDLLGIIAAEKKATPTQKPWIVPIPGTTKLERLDENIGSVAVELTADDLSNIENAAAQITVHGARYPEKLEQITGR